MLKRHKKLIAVAHWSLSVSSTTKSLPKAYLSLANECN